MPSQPQQPSPESNRSPSAASRRQFLATSSAGLAGAAISSSLATAATTSATSDLGFEDAEIKIGLIGAGGRGRGAIANLFNAGGRVKLVAIADAFAEKIDRAMKYITKSAEEVAEKTGVATDALLDVPQERQFVGLDAYQQVLATDCDLVVLATPPGFRPMHFEAAVNAGKHTFLEKPVATDAAGVRRVLATGKLAAEKKLAVQVGLQRRHEALYNEIMSRLHEGAIGDIVYTRVYWNSGGVWVRPRQSQQSEMQYQVNNWYYFTWLSGDHIVEQHIHNLDVGNWLHRATPVEAHGMGGRQTRTGKQFGQIFDHHAVEFTYPDGSKLISQCRHQRDCRSSVGEYTHGTKGRADFKQGLIYGADGKPIYRYKGNKREGHQQEQTDLIAALRRGEIPNECEYGAHSTMTAILGRMATYSGKELPWDKAISSSLAVTPDDFHWDSKPPVLPDADGNYPVPKPGKTEVI